MRTSVIILNSVFFGLGLVAMVLSFPLLFTGTTISSVLLFLLGALEVATHGLSLWTAL